MSAIHANCVAHFGRGVLIQGSPGSGKSTLSLALMAQGAMLVADDYVHLEKRNGHLWARPPDRLAGLMAVRGMELMHKPFLRHTPLALLVSLSIEETGSAETSCLHDWALPRLHLAPYHQDAALRVLQALRYRLL